MITACAALDRSWALPAAFCLFAFAGFAHAACEDAGGCLYENNEWLATAMKAAKDNASSTGDWGLGSYQWGSKIKKDLARCGWIGSKAGWMAVCWNGPNSSRRTYQVFVEKTGKVEELRDKQKVEIKTGCDDNQFLKFEGRVPLPPPDKIFGEREHKHEELPELTLPVCLTECQSEGTCRFCTSGSIGSDNAKAAADWLMSNDWLMENVDDHDAVIKISVVTQGDNGEKTTSELFSLPLKCTKPSLKAFSGRKCLQDMLQY